MHVTGSKYHALAPSSLTRDPHVFPYHLCVLGFSMNKDFLFEQILDFGTFDGKIMRMFAFLLASIPEQFNQADDTDIRHD